MPGRAVSPPLLPAAFAFISQWLPSGATVTALRDAVYFRGDQHVHPIAVLTAWALALFVMWLLSASRTRSATPRDVRRRASREPTTEAATGPRLHG
jgi:hypothetical protein